MVVAIFNDTQLDTLPELVPEIDVHTFLLVLLPFVTPLITVLRFFINALLFLIYLFLLLLVLILIFFRQQVICHFQTRTHKCGIDDIRRLAVVENFIGEIARNPHCITMIGPVC